MSWSAVSMAKDAVVLGAVLSFLTAQACSRPPSVSRIRGATEHYYPHGHLTTLRLESPDGQVVVAVRFPKPIDQSWLPGFGHSGNGDDVTHWEEIYKVRFRGGKDADVLTIAWEYSSRTRKILFAGKNFDLPEGKLAILGYSKDMRPTCEIRDDSRAVVEKLREELVAAKAPPVLPAAPEATP